MLSTGDDIPIFYREKTGWIPVIFAYQGCRQEEAGQPCCLGPRGFKYRSMQSWQEAYERGETGHSMVPCSYRNALKNGEIKKEDVPYMVRGGSWDNIDVFGAKRKRFG